MSIKAKVPCIFCDSTEVEFQGFGNCWYSVKCAREKCGNYSDYRSNKEDAMEQWEYENAPLEVDDEWNW